MKIVRCRTDAGEIVFGEPRGDGTVNVLRARTTDELLSFERTGRRARFDALLAPIDPPNVLCAGRNYRPPDTPPLTEPLPPLELFMKPTTSIIGPEAPIILPRVDEEEDEPQAACEGELAIVIGRTGRNIDQDAALDYVLGYTIANDLTARRWQTKEGPPLWMRGKGFDTFCPLGPHLVTADAINHPNDLSLCMRVNGEIVREGSTAQMVRSVAQLISEISRTITLRPGTLLLTGAPPVRPDRAALDRPLRAGDEITIEIEFIGVLINAVETMIH